MFKKDSHTNRAPSIQDLTGTKDKTKQANALIRALTAPVVEVFVRFDGRNGMVSVNTIGDLKAQGAIELLEKGIEAIRSELAKNAMPEPEE